MPNDAPVAVPPIHRLDEGDAIAPSVLLCSNLVTVDLGPGVLGNSRLKSAAQAYGGLRTPHLPAWMTSFEGHALTEIAARMRTLGQPTGGPADGPKYAFDLHHRLDDYTFVGSPVENQLPILGVKIRGKVIDDDTGWTFANLLEQFNRTAGDSTSWFQVDLRTVQDLPVPYQRHVPRLGIEETWRLVSGFQDVSVGNAVASIALTPGEKRTLKLENTFESVVRRKETTSLIEKITDETENTFKNEFNRTRKNSRESSSETSWSSSSERKYGESGSVKEGGEGASTGKRSHLVEDTMTTLDQIVRSQKRETNLTLNTESEVTETDETTTTREVAISNATDQPVTYVYHHLNARYRVLLELTNLEVVYTGNTPSAETVRLPLDGSLKDDLRGALAGAELTAPAMNAAWKTLKAALEERYGDLGCIALDDAQFGLDKAASPDPAMSIYSRKALTGKRRTKGPLPVNLVAEDRVVQTENLHVVPHLSAYSIPTPAPA